MGVVFNTRGGGGVTVGVSLLSFFSFIKIESLGFMNLNCQLLHEYLVCIVWCGEVYFWPGLLSLGRFQWFQVLLVGRELVLELW
jgi:hypothetical protein